MAVSILLCNVGINNSLQRTRVTTSKHTVSTKNTRVQCSYQSIIHHTAYSTGYDTYGTVSYMTCYRLTVYPGTYDVRYVFIDDKLLSTSVMFYFQASPTPTPRSPCLYNTCSPTLRPATLSNLAEPPNLNSTMICPNQKCPVPAWVKMPRAGVMCSDRFSLLDSFPATSDSSYDHFYLAGCLPQK